MAVSFSSISGRASSSSIFARAYPAGQSAFQASLEESMLHGNQLFKQLWKSLSCMAVTFSSTLGTAHPAWQGAFKHLWNGLSCMAVSFSQASLEESILHGSELFKHLWKSLSCMAVSFSSISGRVYPAWQSAFQASLEEPILNGSQLFKHLWTSLSCRAVSFSSILWKSLTCVAASFSSISGRVYPAW